MTLLTVHFSAKSSFVSININHICMFVFFCFDMILHSLLIIESEQELEENPERDPVSPCNIL